MNAAADTIWILGIIIFILLCATTWFIYAATLKEEVIKKMQDEHAKLMRSFNELDDQAKMIVRTDLELNKVREETDKRLNSLHALQRTSQQMSRALNKDEIFDRIPTALFENLGFTRVLIASIDDNNHLKVRLNLGYKETQAEAILKEVGTEGTLNAALQDTRCVSTINGTQKTKEKMGHSFEAEHFIFSPIPVSTGNIGFVFAGNRHNAPQITQADEELITILAGQIGQSIENARLFEKVFHSSQELELKVAERTKQLASALQKVNEISSKKSEFVSAVSHELRTPLTSIKGYAAILMAGKIGEIPEPVKERLAKINTHSDNLVALINDLLDIARIESGRQEMKFALHKVKNITENLADLLMPQVTAKGVHLQLRLAPEVEEVYIDMTQAERVFINLLSNAIKFTPQNGTITIAVAPALEDGYAVFSVSDTGIGMPAVDLQNLFSEFFRAENEINQNVKGTGLGLVLAKNIVEAHRGRIWVESKVGSGTTFYFTLPPSQKAFDQRSTTGEA
jgi:signal transduction histidine kinase